MKKLLFSVAALATIFSASAQTPYILYSGNSAIDFINGSPYNFEPKNDKGEVVNNLTVKDSLKAGEADKFYYFTGATLAGGYYVGGAGTGSWAAAGNPKIAYTGDVATTTVGFAAFTKGGSVKLNLIFKSASGAWGREIVLTGAETEETVFAVPLNTFKKRDANWAFTGDGITLPELQTVDAFEFGVTYTSTSGVGTAELEFDNFVLVDLTTAINDVAINNSFANEEVTVYNMQGAVVATGTVETLNLSAGFYILKSATHTQKVCIK